MGTAVSRSILPQPLINMVNPVVRRILRSPLHSVLDRALLVLHVVGRKTSHLYDIVVGYVDLDGRLLVVTQHAWRVNLRGVSDVDVTFRGRRQSMRAHLDEDAASVARTLHAVFERIGWQAAGRRLGIKVRSRRTPTAAELEEAVHEYHLSSLILAIR